MPELAIPVASECVPVAGSLKILSSGLPSWDNFY